MIELYSRPNFFIHAHVNYPRLTCWKIYMYPSQPHIHMLHILGTTFYFFFSLSTPGKCTWNLVSFLNSQILCILDSDVFSYYSSMLSMKRGCFSPKSLHVFIYQLFLLCSVLCVYCATYFLNNVIPYEITNS